MNDLISRVALYIWIVVAAGVGTVLYLGESAAGTAEGGTGIHLVFGFLYLIFAGLLLLNFRDVLALIIEEKWIFLLWLWAFVSIAWSPLPGTTLRRIVALLGTTAVGLFFATRFEPKQQIRIVANCLGLSGLASLVACLYFPAYAILPTGEWQGAFYQKNGLGRAMALGLVCYTVLAVGNRRGRIFSIVMAVFCGFMLSMSQSIGAAAFCAMTLVIIVFRKFLVLQARKLMVFGTALLVVAVPAGIYGIQNADAILKSVGREASLTGRIPLWQEVLGEISKHPLNGFGYSAFWYTTEGYLVQLKLGWVMVHAHNGFLEVTLGLGLIGLALLLIGLTSNMLRGVRVARAGESIYDFWPLLYLIYAVFANLTECFFLTANSLYWMLFVASSYWLVRRELEPVTEEEDDTEPDPEFALGNPIGFTPSES